MVWNGNQTTPYSFLQVMKLYSVKSEVRYSPSMILVKLIGSHTISQVTLRISDIKRTKMVRPLLYPSSSCHFYSLSLTVPIIELLFLPQVLQSTSWFILFITHFTHVLHSSPELVFSSSLRSAL